MESKQQPLKISFGLLNDKNYEQLRTINNVCFPIKYSYSFYQKVLAYQKYSRLAYFNDVLIGAMTCREEERDGNNTVYILTICVLDAYRQYKIGSQLMEELMKLVKFDTSIKYIYLHMQINNEVGLAFYKKQGFEIVEKLENYYKDIDPPHCYVMRKLIE